MIDTLYSQAVCFINFHLSDTHLYYLFYYRLYIEAHRHLLNSYIVNIKSANISYNTLSPNMITTNVFGYMVIASYIVNDSMQFPYLVIDVEPMKDFHLLC